MTKTTYQWCTNRARPWQLEKTASLARRHYSDRWRQAQQPEQQRARRPGGSLSGPGRGGSSMHISNALAGLKIMGLPSAIRIGPLKMMTQEGTHYDLMSDTVTLRHWQVMS